MQSSAQEASWYIEEAPEERQEALLVLRRPEEFHRMYTQGTDMMDAHRDRLKGKGVIRYSRAAKIDFRVVERMLRAFAESRVRSVDCVSRYSFPSSGY